MPWVTLTDAGFTPYADYYIGGSGNFYLSGSSLVSSGGIGSSDNTVGLSIGDVTPYDAGGTFSLRLTAISFSVPAGGSTFAIIRDPNGLAEAFPNEAATPDLAYAPSPLVLEFPVTGTSAFAEFATTGPADDSVAGEFLIEILVPDAEPPAIAGPSLTKDGETVEVSPYVPGQAYVAPVPFKMFATPLPLGWAYKGYSTDGLNYMPNSPATYQAWPTQIHRPVQYGYLEGTGVWRFMSIGAVIALLQGQGGGIAINPSHAVYNSDGQIAGYMVYVVEGGGTPYQLPPAWWGPLQDMAFVSFPNVPVSGPYGYPSGQGMFRGFFDAPTLEGVVRVWGNYWKDHNGVLLRVPDQSDPLPPYCSIFNSVSRNPARVVMLADFPGRPAVPAVPAVTQFDGKVGWNAGANSVDTQDGDCRVTFTPNVVAAVVVGLARAPRESAVDPNGLLFAFRCDQPNGSTVRVCVSESGVRVGPYFPAGAESVFVIERVNGVVTYKVDGQTVHTAEALSFQPLCVGACLYYADDGVN